MQDFRELIMKRKRNEKMALATTMIVLAAAVSIAQSGWSSKRIGSGGKDLKAVYFIDSKEGWGAGDGGFFSPTQGCGAPLVWRGIRTQHSHQETYFFRQRLGFR